MAQGLRFSTTRSRKDVSSYNREVSSGADGCRRQAGSPKPVRLRLPARRLDCSSGSLRATRDAWMKTMSIRGDDGTLVDALVGILGHLRACPSHDLRGGPQGALRGAADRFVGKLANHFQYAEKTVFPTLREAVPGLAQDIDGLEKDHRLLHSYARDLATQLKAGDDGGAYAVARSFLAVLLDHMNRERAEVERLSGSLQAGDATRLSEFLSGGRLEPASRGSQES